MASLDNSSSIPSLSLSTLESEIGQIVGLMQTDISTKVTVLQAKIPRPHLERRGPIQLRMRRRQNALNAINPKLLLKIIKIEQSQRRTNSNNVILPHSRILVKVACRGIKPHLTRKIDHLVVELNNRVRVLEEGFLQTGSSYITNEYGTEELTLTPATSTVAGMSALLTKDHTGTISSGLIASSSGCIAEPSLTSSVVIAGSTNVEEAINTIDSRVTSIETELAVEGTMTLAEGMVQAANTVSSMWPKVLGYTSLAGTGLEIGTEFEQALDPVDMSYDLLHSTGSALGKWG